MNIDSSLYIHDSDKAALAALKAIPGFSQVVKAFMKVWDEKIFRLENMSTNLKLSEKQMPKYYNMLLPICEKLGIDVPELYIQLNPVANAWTSGDTKPFITMTSGLLETLPDELIPTVLAHECGHIACHHTLYTTMGSLILDGAYNFISGIGNVAMYPIELAFYYWMRCSEYSADRAALICDGSADKTIEVCMRLAGYDKDIMEEASPELFMEQALEYRELIKDDNWNKTLEFIRFRHNTHPLNAVRAYEANEFSKTERFMSLVECLSSDETDAAERLPVDISLKKCAGKNVEEVYEFFIHNGFLNIALERKTDTAKAKAESVLSVSVNGCLDDGWYNRNDKVVIEYFRPKTEEEIALEHPGEIKIPETQKYYISKECESVVAELTGLGFENIQVRDIAMSKFGIGEKEGCVAKIVIDNQPKLEKDSWYDAGVEIVLYKFIRI